jgi:hypothetical protein
VENLPGWSELQRSGSDNGRLISLRSRSPCRGIDATSRSGDLPHVIEAKAFDDQEGFHKIIRSDLLIDARRFRKQARWAPRARCSSRSPGSGT